MTGSVPERQTGSVPERQTGSVPERQTGSVPEPPPVPQLASRSVVRPYMLTRGRTSSTFSMFALHAPVLALIVPEQLGRTATPEDRRIIELCRTPTSVAEIAARLRAPVGVVRVLVGDLVEARMVQVREIEDRTEHRDVRLLERLLEGIRGL